MDARAHTIFRYGFAVTSVFLVAEIMGWSPAFLPALFSIVVLANIPICPTPKIALGFSLTLALSALLAMIVAYAMRASPGLLFLLCTLVIFHALYLIALGKSSLLPLMVMICISTIPVVALQSFEAAGNFAAAFARAGFIAIFAVWTSYLVFPKIMPPQPKPKPTPLDPVAARNMALLGTAIVAPLVLVYQLLGLTDIMTALVCTVIVVGQLDFHLGYKKAVQRVFANLVGGFASIVLLMLLALNPNLVTMSLLTLLVSLAFGWRISRGDDLAPVFATAFNGCVIVFGSSMMPDANALSVWWMRVFQMFLAGMFTIGMMVLLWPHESRPPLTDKPGART